MLTTRTTLGDALAHIKQRGFEPSTVIDVGVADGTQGLYETFPSSAHLLVEPLSEYESALMKISRKYHAAYVLAAAAEKAGRTTLKVKSRLYMSSILDYSAGPPTDSFERIVPTVTLDDLCEARRLSGPYLVKVDVQGAELNVIEGATRILRETEYVVLELSLGDYIVGSPQFFDVVNYMKGRGFVVYDIFGGWLSATSGALVQVDLAFVKEKGRFRGPSTYDSVGLVPPSAKRFGVLRI
jgi:FkbM family methyltransferase